MNRGIDGFRLDAPAFISKPPINTDLNWILHNNKKSISEGPYLHEYLRLLCA